MSELPEYTPDKDEIRSRLPLAYVCARLGIGATNEQNGRCPFHDDTEPSFGLYTNDDGVTRWGCFPCGKTGDVFDLISQLHGCSFPEAIETALSFLRELPENYEPPAPAPRRKSLTADDWTPLVQEARLLAASKDHAGILSARVGLAPVKDPALCYRWDRYLRDVWGWGISPTGEILMPHWSEEGILVGCKIRKSDGKKTSLDGSTYTGQLYGSWLGHRHQDVLLTEGESDCVYAGFNAREEQVNVDVFSLPSGAGKEKKVEESWLTFLKRYKTIYLCFDPDRVGLEETWKWIEYLEGREVKVCCLPLGKDLRDAMPSVTQLLASARTLLPEPETIVVARQGYFRPGKDGDERRVTNWYIEPIAQLAEGDPGYDVILHYRGTKTETVLRLSDLAGTREIQKWCNKHGILFTGRTDDLQRIAEHVAWRGSVVPEVYQTDQVGLQAAPVSYGFAGPSVVFPGGYVGKMPWRYVPSQRVADVTDRVLLPAPGPFIWSWLEDFLALNKPEVMQPILAWLVASARRSSVREFPLLFIGGSSGTGKSTLARLGLQLVGSKIEVDLGAVTPFILLRTLASSVSLPVFIDEWTKLSRRETRESFQGAVPVLYTGGGAERGQADLSSAVYKMSSPTVIAGEDTFMLDRETERTISVALSREGQNWEALARISSGQELQRFGQLLHSWLTTREDLPPLTGQAGTRPEYNRQILEGGWATLLMLMEDASHSDPTVPTNFPEHPDLSALTSSQDTENVYETALLEGLAMRDNNGHAVVWKDEDGKGTWVRFRRLIGMLKNQSVDLQLPGGERAMKSYFEERFGKVESERVSPPGGFISLHAGLIKGLDLGGEDDPRASFNFE